MFYLVEPPATHIARVRGNVLLIVNMFPAMKQRWKLVEIQHKHRRRKSGLFRREIATFAAVLIFAVEFMAATEFHSVIFHH